MSLTFAPQIIASDNAYWLLHEDFFQPLIPLAYVGRGYTFPYYFYTFPIDQPLSFGERRVRSFDMGESTALLYAGSVQAGVSNENQWWGPGIRNALLLSNNAPGFPHLFLRTGRPVKTPVGNLEVRWLVGALTESRYFDTVTTNNLRSIASIGATLQTRWDPNLTVGIGRSVYATARRHSDIALRWTDVFAVAARRNLNILDQVQRGDSIPGGRDQIFSVFARWVFPKNGAEVYGEWGRTRFPTGLSDFLKAPNHSQGYTIGMQWRGDAWGAATFDYRPRLRSWSRARRFVTARLARGTRAAA